MRAHLVLLVASVGALAPVPAPPAKPTWPSSFWANFVEFYRGGEGQAFDGAFALDLEHVDQATGIKGAQTILRNDGSLDPTCHAVNPGPKCVQISVGGQRYLSFESGSPLCCRCCSWEDGCGPVVPEWTQNASYVGTKVVRGELCYSYEIPGYSSNHLLVRASDGQLCELDNADADYFEFIAKSYKPSVPSGLADGLFKKPAGCDAWCGAKGDCCFGNP